MITLESDLCDRCYQLKDAGAHGVGLCPLQPRSALATAIITDDIPGGVTYDNYGPQPVTFHSHTERRTYMREHGLIQKEKFCPTPGTDVDPAGIPNPKGYVDRQTLENARILLSRPVAARSEDAVDLGSIIRNQRILVDGGKDAQKLVDGDVRRAARVGRRLNGERTVDA